jgi:hypothetical protein
MYTPLAMRPMPASTPFGSVGRSASAVALADAQDERQHARLMLAARGIWDLFMELGPQGTSWTEYSHLSPVLRQSYKEVFLEELAQIPAATLTGAASTKATWRCWATRNHAAVWAPSSIEVSLWLRDRRTGGPTAAHGALVRLRWLENHIGACFHCQATIVPKVGTT